MKKSVLSLILIFFYFNVKSQNLVPNPSFEDTLNCPQFISQISYAPPWISGSLGTPDYFNECYSFPWTGVDVPNNFIGYEYGRTGKAYSGILTWSYFGDAREYIEIQLIDSLVAGIKYRVSFFVSLPDSFWYACNSIGAYLSQTLINDSTGYTLPYSPQISNPSNTLDNKNGWKMVSDTVTAAGGEKYIVIGNFINDVNSDTIHVGGGGGNVGVYNSYYYIDDVSVIPDSATGINEQDVKSNKIKVYPNPLKDFLNIEFGLMKGEVCILEIFDVLGNKVSSYNLSAERSSLAISMKQLNGGIYFYKFILNNSVIKSNKLVIIR